MKNQKIESNQGLIEWYESLTFALAVIIILFTFGVRIVAVNGNSMVPTLQNGERLLISSCQNDLTKGDIVVIDSYIPYGKPLVKRIIAEEGDTVDIHADSGEVYVNGIKLSEEYIADPTTIIGDIEYPVLLTEGQVFVMGDNRLHSTDSRFSIIGSIDKRDILGKVFYRVFPVKKFGTIS